MNQKKGGEVIEHVTRRNSGNCEFYVHGHPEL